MSLRRKPPVEIAPEDDGLALPTAQAPPPHESPARMHQRIVQESRMRKHIAFARETFHKAGAYTLKYLHSALPDRWVRPSFEEGRGGLPLYITHLISLWHGNKHAIRIAFAGVSATFVFLWLLRWLFFSGPGVPGVVDNFGKPIANPILWTEPPRLIDVTAPASQIWLSHYYSERTPIESHNVSRGYIEALVHGVGKRNITLQELSRVIELACPSCQCIAAPQLGIGANVLFSRTAENETILFVEPRVAFKNYETMEVIHRVVQEPESEGGERKVMERRVRRPTYVILEHLTVRGTKERVTLSKYDAACALACIELNTDVAVA